MLKICEKCGTFDIRYTLCYVIRQILDCLGTVKIYLINIQYTLRSSREIGHFK